MEVLLERENLALKQELAALRKLLSPDFSEFSPVAKPQAERPVSDKSRFSLSSHVPRLRKLIIESTSYTTPVKDAGRSKSPNKLTSLSSLDNTNLISTKKSLLLSGKQDKSAVHELDRIRAKLQTVAGCHRDDLRLQSELNMISSSIQSLKTCIEDKSSSHDIEQPSTSLSSVMSRIKTRQSLAHRRRNSKSPANRSRSTSKKRSRSTSKKRTEMPEYPQVYQSKKPVTKKLCEDCIFLLHRGYSTLHCCKHLTPHSMLTTP